MFMCDGRWSSRLHIVRTQTQYLYQYLAFIFFCFPWFWWFFSGNVYGRSTLNLMLHILSVSDRLAKQIIILHVHMREKIKQQRALQQLQCTRYRCNIYFEVYPNCTTVKYEVGTIMPVEASSTHLVPVCSARQQKKSCRVEWSNTFSQY